MGAVTVADLLVEVSDLVDEWGAGVGAVDVEYVDLLALCS